MICYICQCRSLDLLFSLLSFIDLLYLPVLLPWFVIIFVVFARIVISGIFVRFVKPLSFPALCQCSLLMIRYICQCRSLDLLYLL